MGPRWRTVFAATSATEAPSTLALAEPAYKSKMPRIDVRDHGSVLPEAFPIKTSDNPCRTEMARE
jgi:hypothetical protein